MDGAAARDQQTGAGTIAVEQRESEQASDRPIGDRHLPAGDCRRAQSAKPPRRSGRRVWIVGTHTFPKPPRKRSAPCKPAFRAP